MAAESPRQSELFRGAVSGPGTIEETAPIFRSRSDAVGFEEPNWTADVLRV